MLRNHIATLPPDALDAIARQNPNLAAQITKAAGGGPTPLPTLCVYEGPVTEPCKTCNSGNRDVRICAHPNPSDPDRDVCTRIHVSDAVQSCARCRDRKTALDPDSFLMRFDASNLNPAQPSRYRFNSSLAPWKGGYLLAYRTGWAGSEVCVTAFDEDLRPTCRHVQLNLTRPGADYGREDPRLFLYQGVPHVAFVGVEGRNGRVSHTNVLYARLRPETLAAEEVFYPQYKQRMSWEKSWSMFQHGDDLFAVYAIAPRHQVLRIRGNEAVLTTDEENPLKWSGGTLRGGASPVRVGDEFWHFAHDRIEVGGLRVYRTLLYTFDAFPPFRPRRYAPRPILTADRRTKPADQYAAVVFPCGAVLRDRKWVVSHGVHDRYTEFHQWSHSDLENRLVKV